MSTNQQQDNQGCGCSIFVHAVFALVAIGFGISALAPGQGSWAIPALAFTVLAWAVFARMMKRNDKKDHPN